MLLSPFIAGTAFWYSVTYDDVLWTDRLVVKARTEISASPARFEKDARCEFAIDGATVRITVAAPYAGEIGCVEWEAELKQSQIVANLADDFEISLYLLSDLTTEFTSRSFQDRLSRFDFGIYLHPKLTVETYVDYLEHELFHALSLERYDSAKVKVPTDDMLFVVLEETRAQMSSMCVVAQNMKVSSTFDEITSTDTTVPSEPIATIEDQVGDFLSEQSKARNLTRFSVRTTELLRSQADPAALDRICSRLLDFNDVASSQELISTTSVREGLFLTG